MSRVFAAASLATALAATLFLSFANVYSGEECAVYAGGEQTCVALSGTLADQNGRWVFLLLMVPITLSAVVLVSTLPRFQLPRAVAWTAAGALLLACMVTGFSIGLFFLPAALLALAAAGFARSTRGRGDSA